MKMPALFHRIAAALGGGKKTARPAGKTAKPTPAKAVKVKPKAAANAAVKPAPDGRATAKRARQAARVTRNNGR